MGKWRSKEEQAKICDEWKRSGLQKAEFCRQNSLNKNILSRWLYKIKNKDNAVVPAKSKAVEFLPIGNIAQGASFIEIVMSDGIKCKACLPAEKIEGLIMRLVK